LQAQTKSFVASYIPNAEPSNDLVTSLVKDLNLILNGNVFYDPIVFKDVPLTKPVRAIADENYAITQFTEGAYLTVNKIILEDSFFGEVGSAKLPDQYMFLTKNINEYYSSVKKSVPKIYTISAALQSFIDESKLLSTMEDHYRQVILDLKKQRGDAIQLGLDLVGGIRVTIRADFETLAKDTKQDIGAIDKVDAMKRVLEILNSRIDQFGVTEPQIRKQGEERIIVELPGLADPERIRKVILGKGRLNFHIVDDNAKAALDTYIQKNPTDFLTADKKSLKDPTIIPKGDILLPVVEKDKYDLDFTVGYTVVKEEPALAGEFVESASVQYDPNMGLKPNVTFHLSQKGGEIFYNVTTANIKKFLAVVLDDKIKFQATIQEAIRADVQVHGQGISQAEADDLALLLRTGSLPVPLEIIAQESVGASLGEDAIKQGINAALFGSLLVVLFMFGYYKGGGVNANIALLLNVPLIAGILSVFNYTLSMPGIAGFVLNIGMAVDANVIIFERIKEEFRAGKSRTASIKAGFGKATITILDSNLTTIFAAVALGIFGKGPVQGFAVMLIVGICCSMFTAVYISRLLYDFVTDTFKTDKISLSWRRITG
jgi:preprotein translocase subunit SecD